MSEGRPMKWENMAPDQRRAAWLAALRSGTYVQARGALRDNDGHCCLGVLCDLVDPGAWMEDRGALAWGCFWSDEIPRVLLGDVGLSPTLGDTLASMNDTGSSFDEIAEYIERRAKEHDDVMS